MVLISALCVMFSMFCQAPFVSHNIQCFQLGSSVLVQTSSSQRLIHSSGFQFSLRTCSSPSSLELLVKSSIGACANQSEFLPFFLLFQNSFRFLNFPSFYCFSASLVHCIQFFNSLLIVSSQHGDKDLLIDPYRSFYHCILLIIVVSLFSFLMLLYFIVMLFDIISFYLSLLHSLFVTLSLLL